MSATEQIREIVMPVLDSCALELYDIEHDRGVVKILVDRPGGVDLDVLAGATRLISSALDELDPFPGSYSLEVSSPGLERPLRRPEHFEGAVGELVRIKCRAGFEGERRVRGTLASADSAGIEIQPDDGHLSRIAYADIERAETVFEWGPSPKPGGKDSRKRRGKTAERSGQSREQKAAKS
ncbi:MAG: Ribosome maturation factor RimP [Acidimicrobiales bacterium]|nr:MAG: ribosome maturation factor RimP [Actinomycetota bacterium]MBV6509176.1 Ribosome maturation factor RimP [Acidimicrobiales bacterium]RIK08478.1 MAG: ribosome maturation factor RimP [Acidobacteriota bacterium]